MKKASDCSFKRIEELEQQAEDFGFYWEHIDQLIEQIQSESLEVQEAWKKNDRAHLKEEIGDLMLAAMSLAIFCELDPHETLLESIEKYEKRYRKVVEAAKKDGHTHLRGQPFDVLIGYWNRAKK